MAKEENLDGEIIKNTSNPQTKAVVNTCHKHRD
jgi:hypothetical protein